MKLWQTRMSAPLRNMSSVTDPQPDPAADEIVAYLDGELPPQDCRRVESRLATDEEYRQELHELDRAWEALDVLPAPTVDDAFARTTIELACVAADCELRCSGRIWVSCRPRAAATSQSGALGRFAGDPSAQCLALCRQR